MSSLRVQLSEGTLVPVTVYVFSLRANKTFIYEVLLCSCVYNFGHQRAESNVVCIDLLSAN